MVSKKIFTPSYLNTGCYTRAMIGCRESSLKAMGTVGTILFIFGVAQIGGGLYFLLVLPGFSVCSNIWAGATSGLVGVLMMYFGYSNQARRNVYIILVFSLTSFLANTLNVVIIQVGEKVMFITDDHKKTFSEHPEQEFIFEIAIWASTVISSAAMLLCFVTSQCLFWCQLKGPIARRQTSFLDDINDSQKGNRFFPPSRLFIPKDTIQILPPVDDVIVFPDPTAANVNSSWVYNSDDKESLGLYPIGLEVHPEVLDSTRRSPARHSSFAASQYARVHQRPKRAQSFATTRDPFSLHGSRILRPVPVSVPHLFGPTSSGQKVRKSSSFAGNAFEGVTTLSRKYRIFTQNRDLDSSIIEVGSLKSAQSDHSLANALTDLPTTSVRHNTLQNKDRFVSTANSKSDETSKNTNESSQEAKKVDHTLPRTHNCKGPAPLPPANKATSEPIDEKEKVQSEATMPIISESVELEDTHDTDTLENLSTVSVENESIKKEESVGYCSCSETFGEIDEMEANNSSAISYESHTHRKLKCYSTLTLSSSSCTSSIEQDDEALSSSEMEEINTFEEKTTSNLKLPRFLAQNQNELTLQIDKNTINVQNQSADTTSSNLIKKYHVAPLSIHDKEKSDSLPDEYEENSSKESVSENPKGILKNNLPKQNEYESVHCEVLECSKALLEQLPTGEVQKNKIVLRVPSFKTTGCQTESYRPIRRRVSCSQDNRSSQSVPLSSKEISEPRYWVSQNHNSSQTLNTASSSSSGYSSPERDSKTTSPINSGPPFPGSHYTLAAETPTATLIGPNITIIEVNREDCRTSYNVKNNNIQTNCKLPISTEVIAETNPISEYGRVVISNDVVLLTEAVNPVLVHSTKQNTVPRIIDAIRKPSQERPSRFHTFATRSQQKCPNRVNSLSLPRIAAPSTRSRIYRGASRSPSPEYDSPEVNATNSTAAYLASLEILASHYRQQALANAKQLQIQQKLMEQQNADNSYFQNVQQGQRHFQTSDRDAQNDVIHE